MERLGHAQLTTAQRYLHTLPDTDEQALAAFERIRSRSLPKPINADEAEEAVTTESEPFLGVHHDEANPPFGNPPRHNTG